MKRNLVILSLVAICILFSSFALAGTGAMMQISVPFDFYAGNQQLPAGDYTFQMATGLADTASMVTIRSKEGKGICMLFTRPGTDQNEGRLLFNKYGSKHFLSSVSIQGFKAGVRIMELEKELRAQADRDRSTVTIAQR